MSDIRHGSRVRLRIHTSGPRRVGTGEPFARYGDPPHRSRGVVGYVGPADPVAPQAGRLLGVMLDSGEEAWVMECEVRRLSGDGL